MATAILKRKGRSKRGLVALASLLLLTPGISQGSAGSPVTGYGFTTAETAKGFPYMTGGVGIDERQVMEQRDDPFNLKLVFAEKSGLYLADVRLRILNQDGREIAATAATGPWFYIQLPPGEYDVQASFDGKTQMIRNIEVSEAQQTTRILHWDLPSEPEHPQLVSY